MRAVKYLCFGKRASAWTGAGREGEEEAMGKKIYTFAATEPQPSGLGRSMAAQYFAPGNRPAFGGVELHSKKLWLVIGLCLVFALPSSNAFAWDKNRGRSQGHDREIVRVGHERYHYRDGRFYRLGWFGFEFAVFAPPIGAIVATLPFGYRTIIVGGSAYYYYDSVYYRTCPFGYVVVPTPVAGPNVLYAPPAVVQPQTPTQDTVVINVPNANGGYVAVTLVKQNNGYIGPQGEYYPGHPTIEQLKALYGK